MFAAIVAGARRVLLVGLCRDRAGHALHSIRARTIGALLVTAALPLIAVVASGLIMFESEHDLMVLAIVVGTTRGGDRRRDAAAARHRRADRRARTRPRTRSRPAISPPAPPQTGVAETDELADAFNAMAEYVESLFDARRQLVAWASHDLRTPLAAMQAMLEAIEDGVSTPEEYLPEMQRPGAATLAVGRRPLRAGDDRRRRRFRSSTTTCASAT